MSLSVSTLPAWSCPAAPEGLVAGSVRWPSPHFREAWVNGVVMVEGAAIPCPKCCRVAIAHLARALEVCIAESLGTSLGSASRGQVPQDCWAYGLEVKWKWMNMVTTCDYICLIAFLTHCCCPSQLSLPICHNVPQALFPGWFTFEGPTSVMKQPVPMCSCGTKVARFWTFGLWMLEFLRSSSMQIISPWGPEIVMNCRSDGLSVLPCHWLALTLSAVSYRLYGMLWPWLYQLSCCEPNRGTISSCSLPCR